MSANLATAMAVRLGAWMELVRPPVVFAAWSNVLAAHLIATAGDPQWRALALQLAISSGLFAAGGILGDCFDRGRDRDAHPERPLPSGRIAVAAAWVAGLALLGAGLLLAVLAGIGPLLVAALLAALVLGYSAGLKHTALGPPAVGLGRWVNWLLGLGAGVAVGVGAGAGLPPTPLLLTALPVLLYGVSMALLRRAEYAGGRRRALRPAAVLLGLALAAALLLYPFGVLTDPYALALTALCGVLLLRRLLRLMEDPTPARVRAAGAFMLLCMVPLDALLLGGHGQRLAASALLLLMLPDAFLAWRRQQN